MEAKDSVAFLLRWAADNVLDEKVKDVLLRIFDTPISPELLPPDNEGKAKDRGGNWTL